MGEPKKFLFDNFVIEEKKKEKKVAVLEAVIEDGLTNLNTISEITDADFEEYIPEAETKTYSEEELADKIKIAEQDGYERGFRTSQDGMDAIVSRLMEDINNKLLTLVANSSNLSCELEKQSLDLATAVIEKLVPTLNAEHAVEIVNKFISDNFNNFKDEAKLSFYIHPDIISYVQENISRLANSYDFEGKIALHKDAKLALADCRVEWENGSVERNINTLSKKVEDLLTD